MAGVLSRHVRSEEYGRPSAASRTLGTVLLVDDRSYDRRALARALAARRLAARTLPSAARALVHVGRDDEPLDALLCSSGMPGCADFLRAAATLRPGLRLVLLDDVDGESASSDPAASASVTANEDAPCVIARSSPPEAVAEAVEAVLRGDRAGAGRSTEAA